MNNPRCHYHFIKVCDNNPIGWIDTPINNPFDCDDLDKIRNYLANKKIRDKIYRNKTKLKK